MGIRFIQQEDRLWIDLQVRQHQQRLLQSTARAGEVELNSTSCLIFHLDLAPFRNVHGLVDCDTKQRLNSSGQLAPGILSLWPCQDLIAQIS